MTRKEFIEIVEDQFSQLDEYTQKKHLHPEIIAHNADKYYRYYISMAYGRSPDSVSNCLYRDKGLSVQDDGSGNLYSLPTKEMIPFFGGKGGVFSISKVGGSELKFEGYNGRFERNHWSDINVPYSNNVRYWVEEGNENVETLADSIVWYDFDNSEISTSDTVDMELLITFVAHDDSQEISVPKEVGGVAQLLDTVIQSFGRKLGFDPDKIIKQKDEE